MPRPERPLGNGGPVERFAAELRQLRERAGRPGYRRLAEEAHFAPGTLAAAAGGRRLPTLAVTLAYVTACGGDRAEWEARWRAVADEISDTSDTCGRSEAAADEAPPYRGLAPYRLADADWFFGRERLVAGLVERLTARRLIALFGVSGSGKSSLLRAGLVPAMRDRLAGGVVVVLTAGPHPLAELSLQLARLTGVPAGALLDDLRTDPARAHLAVRQALADAPPEAELLIVVDQFEEVFTRRGHERDRAEFVSALLAMAHAGDSRARVVLGVRADFYACCTEFPHLVEALSDASVLVGPMTAAELREAVTRPAERAGLMVEGALVSTVVAAVAGRPGALPLASHALLEAWRRRRGSAITLDGYEAAGGLAGAVAQTAEDVYAGLDGEQRDRCREVLLRLIEIGADGVVTGRSVAPAEFDGAEADPGLLERLAAARLLTIGEGRVELAHDALISAWPRLRGWVDEDREGLRLHRQLTQAASIWQSLRSDPGALYRGVRLLDAVRWSARYPTRLTSLERHFLDASTAADRRERRSRRRRLRLALAGLVSALTAISVLAALVLAQATAQARRARSERDLAVTRQLIADARAKLPIDPQPALVLARRAFERDPVGAETVLRQATLNSRLVGVLGRSADPPVYGLAFAPDGRHVAVTVGNEVRIWDTVSGRDEAPGVGQASGYGVAYSADGRLLAAVRPQGGVSVWSLADPKTVTVVGGRGRYASSVAFSPDGGRLALAGDDGTVRIERADGRPGGTVLRGHRGRVTSVVFSPDGGYVASAGDDGTVRINRVDGRSGGTVLRGHVGPATSVAYSPDGRLIASAGEDGTIRLWRTDPPGSPLVFQADGGAVSSVAFSPDGARLATARADGTVQIWITASTVRPLVLRGHRAAATAVAFSPDGRRLTSAAVDGTVRLWDTTGPAEPRALSMRQDGLSSAVVSPDGRLLASGGSDGTVWLLSLAEGGPPRALRGGSGRVLSLSVSSDGRRLASIEEDRSVRVWDLTDVAAPPMVLSTFRPRWPPAEAAARVSAVALSPDGRYLVGGGPGGVYLWPVRDGAGPQRLLLPIAQALTWSVAFSPDGRYVASAGDDGAVRLADVAGHRSAMVLHRHDGPAYNLAFSPDGRWLASTGQDGAIFLSNVDGSGSPTVLPGQTGAARTVAFSPDGQMVVSTGQDGSVRLWTVATGGEPVSFSGPGPSFDSAVFTTDGRQLIGVHRDGAVRLWQCEVCGPIDQVLVLADQRTR